MLVLALNLFKMTKGIIFDIQKFALHDGPGIRTAVFLKGCPLRCQWCCNPESWFPGPQLSFNKARCTECLKCVPLCTRSALQNKGGKFTVDFGRCNACQDCLPVCIPDALKIYGWETTPQKVLNEVIKDKDYFLNSGGGLTLTGGEPLFQIDFATEILRLAKENNIHTCIETSGYSSPENLQKIVRYTDLFLFDFKHYNDNKHLAYTNVSNRNILKNLDTLCQTNHQVILRCPIIPGINNTREHFRAIASISNKYKAIQAVEILPFHDWGFHKYEQIGMKKPNIIYDTPAEKSAVLWLEMIREEGCSKARLG